MAGKTIDDLMALSEIIDNIQPVSDRIAIILYLQGWRIKDISDNIADVFPERGYTPSNVRGRIWLGVRRSMRELGYTEEECELVKL